MGSYGLKFPRVAEELYLLEILSVGILPLSGLLQRALARLRGYMNRALYIEGSFSRPFTDWPEIGDLFVCKFTKSVYRISGTAKNTVTQEDILAYELWSIYGEYPNVSAGTASPLWILEHFDRTYP